jgi:hypothetical protein
MAGSPSVICGPGLLARHCMLGHIPNVMARYLHPHLIAPPSTLRAVRPRDERYRTPRVALVQLGPRHTFRCGVFRNCCPLRHFEG